MAKKEAPKNKGGRKAFAWTPEHIKKVKELAASGINDRRICEWFGISHDCFYKHLKINNELNDALKHARIGVMSAIATVVIKKALAGDLKAAAIFIENKKFWSERENELTDESDTPSKPTELTASIADLLGAVSTAISESNDTKHT